MFTVWSVNSDRQTPYTCNQSKGTNFNTSVDPTPQALREKDETQQAIIILEQLLEEHPFSPLKDQARWLLTNLYENERLNHIKSLLEEKQTDQALVMLEDLFESGPPSYRADEFMFLHAQALRENRAGAGRHREGGSPAKAHDGGQGAGPRAAGDHRRPARADVRGLGRPGGGRTRGYLPAVRRPGARPPQEGHRRRARLATAAGQRSPGRVARVVRTAGPCAARLAPARRVSAKGPPRPRAAGEGLRPTPPGTRYLRTSIVTSFPEA